MDSLEDAILKKLHVKELTGLPEAIQKFQEPYRSLLFSAYYYQTEDHEKAVGYAQDAFDMAFASQSRQQIIRATSRLAECLIRIGRLENAIDVIEANYQIFKSAKNLNPYEQKWIGYVHYQYAVALAQLSNFDKSMQQFKFALEYGQKNNDNHLVSSSFNGLAIVSEWIGKMKNAETYYKKSLRHKPKNTIEYAVTLGNYGALLLALGKTEQATATYRKALAIFERKGTAEQKILIYQQLASIATDHNQPTLALNYCKKILAAAKTVNLPNDIAYASFAIGLINVNLGNLPDAEKALHDFEKTVQENTLKHLLPYLDFLKIKLLLKQNKHEALPLLRKMIRQENQMFAHKHSAIQTLLTSFLPLDNLPEKAHIVREIEMTFKKMQDGANETESPHFYASVLKLRALLSKISGDHDKFHSLLSEAISIAKKHHYPELEAELKKTQMDTPPQEIEKNVLDMLLSESFQREMHKSLNLPTNEVNEFYDLLNSKFGLFSTS